MDMMVNIKIFFLYPAKQKYSFFLFKKKKKNEAMCIVNVKEKVKFFVICMALGCKWDECEVDRGLKIHIFHLQTYMDIHVL